MKTNYIIKSPFFLAFVTIIIVSFFSCDEKVFDNPYDPDVSIDSLAPYDLEVEEVTILEKKLTWKFNAVSHEGFMVYKKTGEADWVKQDWVDNDVYEWLDSDIEINQTYQYKIEVMFDKNTTISQEIEYEAILPVPENFEIIKNSVFSVTLNWNYPYQGHDGFQIDRMVDSGNWEVEYQVVEAGFNSFEDVVDLNSHNYTYRISSIFQTFESIYEEEVVDQEISTIDIDMVFVEGGSFEMGCNSMVSNCLDHEIPMHDVFLNDFYISKYEISNVQFAEFLNDINCSVDGSFYDDEYGSVKYIEFEGNINIDVSGSGFSAAPNNYNDPAIFITWFGANAFAKWAGGRLPTEAEWEFASRGGVFNGGSKYSGSNVLDGVGMWKGHIHFGDTILPGGWFNPNELGLYDMSGNAQEWCSDWYDENYYSNSPSDNPQGSSSGTQKVIRGGGFRSDSTECRNSARSMKIPSYSDITYGFRIVR